MSTGNDRRLRWNLLEAHEALQERLERAALDLQCYQQYAAQHAHALFLERVKQLAAERDLVAHAARQNGLGTESCAHANDIVNDIVIAEVLPCCLRDQAHRLHRFLGCVLVTTG